MIPTPPPTPDPTISVEQARRRVDAIFIGSDFGAIDTLIAAVRAESHAALVQAEQARDEARRLPELATGEPGDYYLRALELVADMLRKLKPEELEARAPKLIAIITNAVATLTPTHEFERGQRDLLARVREMIEFLPLPIHEDSTYYRVGYLAAIGNLTLKLDTVFGDPPSDPPAPKE